MIDLLYAQVAGLNIEFRCVEYDTLCKMGWGSFLLNDMPNQIDLVIHLDKTPQALCLPPVLYSIPPITFCTGNDGIAFYRSVTDGTPDMVVYTRNNWVQITIKNNSSFFIQPRFMLLLNIVFRTRLAYFSGFTAHASVITYKGESIIFTAPSGVGKSTHAELWHNYLNAEIVNGDYAVTRIHEDRPIVYGAPWSGTSPYKKQIAFPLKAIVVLQQARQNEIRRITPEEFSIMSFTTLFLPCWDKLATAKTLDSINIVLTQTPLYLLKCLPDESAALLVKKTVFAE